MLWVELVERRMGMYRARTCRSISPFIIPCFMSISVDFWVSQWKADRHIIHLYCIAENSVSIKPETDRGPDQPRSRVSVWSRTRCIPRGGFSSVSDEQTTDYLYLALVHLTVFDWHPLLQRSPTMSLLGAMIDLKSVLIFFNIPMIIPRDSIT